MVAKNLKRAGEFMIEIGQEKLTGRRRYMGEELNDPRDIKLARIMATKAFVELGKIKPELVDEDGILKSDNILEISNFFASFDAKQSDDRAQSMVTTTRLLWHDEARVEDLRLPIEQIDGEYREQLQALEPGAVAEIGSLVKKPGTPTVAALAAFRALWMFADSNGVEKFVCGLEPDLYPSFYGLFGNALTKLSSENVKFPGIDGGQVPLLIDVQDAVLDQQTTTGPGGLLRHFAGRYITQDADGVKWR